ncbi:hypothetical protein [Lentilactobacillus sp. Marseille-Q4993]|uniref:hypothetical protein n=1 Tax=Lentilactobacillus sp. Marseille-Q4993 TaxID=3039492 RepID=UPI0024BCDA1C|nr:hypothetical protein [Lentilactobacillus sp. Marseille-Q4993]
MYQSFVVGSAAVLFPRSVGIIDKVETDGVTGMQYPTNSVYTPSYTKTSSGDCIIFSEAQSSSQTGIIVLMGSSTFTSHIKL